MNLLQGWVTKKEGWRRGLDTELPIEPRIRRDFDEEFEKRDDLPSCTSSSIHGSIATAGTGQMVLDGDATS